MIEVVHGNTSYSQPETLRVDDELSLSRRAPSGVLMLSTTTNSSAATLAQLENAYSLRDELDVDWATLPVGLLKEGNRLTLTLQDPGGQLLDRLAGCPLGVAEFLRLAIGLAVALGALHKRGTHP